MSVKKIIFFFVLLISCANAIHPQESRTRAMGGVSYSIKDVDYSFDPYDLGNNPAWLYLDETETWLKILPSFAHQKGDYKRFYDPSSTKNYSLGFRGIKTLGTDGTFLGETDYSYELRRDLPRSLKYDTYAGEAFFMADTNKGNFRYNGPSIKFMYSYELLPSLYLGASANYRILDGLKNVYSRASILYREVGGTVGLAYKCSNELAFGLTGILSDEQEKIESASEELTEVEIFYFRGETFSIKKRSSVVTQTIRKKEKGIGAQVYYTPTANCEFGLHADLSNQKENVLVPFSTSTQSFEEYSEGYADFQKYNLLLKGRYSFTPEWLIGGSIEYHRRSSWSKNPARDLLLWKWSVNQLTFGVGSSYYPIDGLLVSAEYEFGLVNADSSKYIDSRTTKIKSNNHQIKVGSEYKLFDNSFLRAGYNFGMIEKDMLGGGENVQYHLVTFGCGIKFYNSFDVDLSIIYNSYAPKNGSVSRSRIGCFLTTKLYSF